MYRKPCREWQSEQRFLPRASDYLWRWWEDRPMLVELHGKGGCLCQPARQGKLHCPLIVRPTSEDVVTSHLFQVLQVLNPHWWLADFLNLGPGCTPVPPSGLSSAPHRAVAKERALSP